MVAMLLDSAMLLAVPAQHANGTQQSQGLNFLLQPTHAEGGSFGQQDSTNSTTRAEIMSYIAANPGMYLRGLCENLDLSMGVVQYHVWALVKNDEVEEYHKGRYRRFFESGTYSEMEQKVISLLRQKTAGRILIMLTDGPPIEHGKLQAALESPHKLSAGRWPE